MLVGSDRQTDRQTMSLIELSWTAKKDTLDDIWIFLHPKFPSITDPGKRLPPVISAPAPASRIKVSWDETDEAA